MRSETANEDFRLLFWLHAREFAVPPSMIETATARRASGDWAGACAAAHVDVDLNLRSVAGAHGREFVARIRDDLRHLAPDLLRWHMPRVAPDGLLRPGLTLSLARYGPAEQGRGGTVHLVARTPPAWAAAGQRISLALWDDSRSGAGLRGSGRPGAGLHPHARPHRRFRLDLHRHLWDVRRTDELRVRSGADRRPAHPAAPPPPGRSPGVDTLPEPGCAVDRWAAEAAILLRADGHAGDAVAIRLGGRRQLVLRLNHGLPDQAGCGTLPMLPDAATWVLPDLALLRAGLIEADRLHPLVAPALVPDHSPPQGRERAGGPIVVECRGARHRLGLVDGVLVPLDHDQDEIRRERLLADLTGTPLPCLRMIVEAHRDPGCLDDIRARLDHGDTAGALAAVESLLGPGATLPGGALRDELEAAARRQVAHGLFRTGLVELEQGPAALRSRRPTRRRTQPRHTLPPR
ncbi:hypothetical protein AB0I81_10005 [Nonomuraea sp. NPDC050404]|uniref:hypothetical protein n=1 Tax=Nonomuraea sp. NPDC050404 TaxID=3155783 RepID=UPI0033EFF304